jgi:hypothetical protein
MRYFVLYFVITPLHVSGPFAAHHQKAKSLVWKNARKNDTKNRISNAINRIIPHHRPCVTISVCNLWYIISRVTSLHHWIMVSAVMIAPIPNRLSSYW